MYSPHSNNRKTKISQKSQRIKQVQHHQFKRLHSATPCPHPHITLNLTKFSSTRKFSTQQQYIPKQQQQQPTLKPDDEEANRNALKIIVSTMNADQQMVVQALVAESSMLRNEINHFSQAIQAQEEQAKRVMAQLNQIQAEQRANNLNRAPSTSNNIEDEVYHHLDISSPTYLQDMIAIEKNPRVKQALERELQLRQEIKPLLEIMEVAAQEKIEWKKRSSRSSLALFTLAGLLVGQSIMLYTMGTPEAHGGIALSHDQNMQIYLQEAVDIIQQYESKATITDNINNHNNNNDLSATNTHLPTKWTLFKEKLRLHNLANPKTTIQFQQVLE